MSTTCKMLRMVFLLWLLVSVVCGSYQYQEPANGPWDGGLGVQQVVGQQSLDEPQPSPNVVPGEYWWQADSNSPAAQQQQHQQQHQHQQQQQQQHHDQLQQQQHQHHNQQHDQQQHPHHHQLQQQQHHHHQQHNQQQHPEQQQVAPVVQPHGICTAPDVCPASSVCVLSQLCQNGFLKLVTDGSGLIDIRYYATPILETLTGRKYTPGIQRCGNNMVCCKVPSCNQQVNFPPVKKPSKPDPIIQEPSVIHTVKARPPTNPPFRAVTTTMMPMMMMMMGPMRSPGNCSAGLYCVERPECDRNGFIINNPNQHIPVHPELPGVPLLTCEVRKGNIQDGVCCQQVHPNPQGFD